MKRTPVVFKTIGTACLILATGCGQNAHVTRRTTTPQPGAAQTASTVTPGTVSWTMSDADLQSCPKSGEGVVLKKFVDKNGNGKMDDGESVVEGKIVCSGAIGAPGAAGAKGDTGATGAKGDKGDAGAAGVAGATGEKGEAGPAGPKGDTGPVGPAGPAGPAGEKGEAGPAGPAGPAGEKGEAGPAGPAGPAGEKGEAGPAGPAGPKGDAGAPGVATDGSSGPTVPQAPTSLAISDATTEQCASGGKVVETYVDANNNGKKDADEAPVTTGLVCNGDRGDGTTFTIADATAEACPSGKGITVAISGTTETGTTPTTATMTFCEGKTPEKDVGPKIAKRDADKSEKECPLGGIVLELYYDANGDGRKEPLEFIASTGKFCKTAPSATTVVAVLSAEDRATIDTLKAALEALAGKIAHVDDVAGKVETALKDAGKLASDAKASADLAGQAAEAAKAAAAAAGTPGNPGGQGGQGQPGNPGGDGQPGAAGTAPTLEQIQALLDQAKAQAQAAQASADAAKASAGEAATSSTAAAEAKAAAELARDAALQGQKAAEAAKLAAEESNRATLAQVQGLVEAAQGHRAAAEAAAAAAEAHRKAAELAKDAIAPAQTALESAKTDLKAQYDLAMAKIAEIAAAVEALKSAPRTPDGATQGQIASIEAQLAQLAEAAKGHSTKLQGQFDQHMAALNARAAELEARGTTIQNDIDTKIAQAKADASQAAKDAATAKDLAAEVLKRLAEANPGNGGTLPNPGDVVAGNVHPGQGGSSDLSEAVTAAKADITAHAEAKKKEISDLVAPLSGSVEEVKRLAEEMKKVAADLPGILQKYVDAAKSYFEQAEAARGQIPATIEDLQRKSKEAEDRIRALVNQVQTGGQGSNEAVAQLRADFEAYKSKADGAAAEKDAALRALLGELKTASDSRLQAIEQKIAAIEGLQGQIDKLKAEIGDRLAKLELLANNRPGTVASNDPCEVTRPLTDVTSVDRNYATKLMLPYDPKHVPVVAYGSPGDKVRFLGDSLQVRLNKQELFQVNTKGLPQLLADDLVEGTLKAKISLILTKNMTDKEPYDYTEILCSVGSNPACTGQRYQDGKFGNYIAKPFWDTLKGKDVASNLLVQKLTGVDKSEVRVFDVPGVQGQKYNAFKRTVEFELGEAFNGQTDLYSLIYGQDGNPKTLLPFVIADDIRLYGVTLTVSYRTKTCSAQR